MRVHFIAFPVLLADELRVCAATVHKDVAGSVFCHYHVRLRAIMDTPDFVEGHYDTGFIAKNGEHLHQCIMRTSERAENIALIAAYMDYLMNLEENSGDATDNRPISKWKEFGLHKGVLRI